MSSKKKFEMTQEEVDEIKSALQKEEFRKLLVEYAKEIADPENRKRYEEEITQMERERGQDIKFLHPKPGFVIKAKDVDTGKKLFLNLCHNEMVGLATAVPSTDAGKVGQKWSIPYSLTPPREDFDSEQRRCMVYDVVFHTSTFEKGEKDPRFRQLLIDTALGGLQRQWNININKKALRFPKMAYKGVAKPTLVRRPRPGGPPPEASKSPFPFPYPEPVPVPVEKREEEGEEGKREEGGEGKTKEKKKKKKKGKRPDYEPKYTVVHRGEVEWTDFTNSRISSAVKHPKELVVTVELAGVETVADVELEVFERRLELVSQNPVYKLELDLHYSVNCDRASAKFDKSTHILTVTLPVIPSTPPPTTLLPPESPPSEGEGLQEDEDHSSPDERREMEVSAPPKEVADKDSPTVSSAVPSSDTHSEGPLLPATLRRCPPYRYRHDDKRVVFVLDVRDVNPGTVVTHFDDSWAQITFSAASESFSFFVQFESSCKCVPAECSVDVSSDNVVVVVLLKAEDGVEWSSFTVGPTAADTTKKLFYTPHNIQQTAQELQDPWLHNGTGGSEERATDVSCWAEEGTLLVQVSSPVSAGLEENGCSRDGSEDDPSMSPHEIPAKAETLPMTATQPANDTSLSDSSSTDVTMSPPSDSVSPSVNENASPEDSHKVSHDSSDNVSPTESDKVEQCESKDHPRDPLPINMFKLSLGNNNYVFDLD